MSYELIVRPEAETDLAEICAWYEEKRRGLGHDFLHQVEAGFQFINENPFVSTDLYKGVRRYLIKRFPYKIFYYIANQKVSVLAIVYSGRNPELIQKRIRKN